MKKINFTLLFLIQIIYVSAQNNWTEMMDDPQVNFYDVQTAFENYFQNHPIEKGKGWKQFKRWEYFMEPRVYPSGERFSYSKVYEEYQNYIQSHPQNRTLTGQWSYIGNHERPNDGGGSGRINCIAFESGNNNVIYVGTPAGGLWKTYDGGNNWEPLTDNLPTLGISSIVTHPSDPNIVYIGTGDADGSDMYSVGVMKSTDAGATFQLTGLSFSYTANVEIRKLIIHPTNPDILLAATSNGVYKTIDGGVTWNITLTGSYYDLEFKPNDPTVIYTTAIAKFYKSTDTGDNFTQITNGVPTTTTGAARVLIGVSPANSNYVYLFIGASDNGFHSFYRSTDAGDTFTLRTDTPNLLGWDTNGGDSGGQAYYDMAIVVSTTNINDVWVGGVNIWKTTNGGTNFSLDAHWYGGGGQPYVHADIHAMENVPGENNTFLVGCDGGVFKTTNAGTTYSDISDGLQIAQIYKMGTSTSNPDLIISGWQDNGTNLKTSTSWDKVLGGDGMDCMINHSNNSVMYGELYYGDIYKSTNGGNSFNGIVSSGGTAGTVDEDGNWVTPMTMHPTNGNTFLVGKSQVYRTTNAGSSFTTVGSVSGGTGKVVEMAYAPSDPNFIYVIKQNKFFASTDGNTFTDRTAGLTTAASFTNLAVDSNNPLKVWVTYSGFNSNAKVYHTNDGGVTWSNYGTGLPNMPVNCIVYQNNSADALYIGTDMGVFYRDSTLSSWQYFSDGLPNTIVNDLEIFYPTGKLRAATYGRGIWETELYSNILNDASIVSVSSPNGNVCGVDFAPNITLSNEGDNDLTSVEIIYSIDAGVPLNYFWNGMLHPNESLQISLPVVNVSLGTHTFQVGTNLPNGTIDGNTSNDNMNTNFNVINTGNEVDFTLALDCFGKDIAWQIQDGASNIVYQVNFNTYQGSLSVPAVTPDTISTTVCLDAGCYTFTINDAGGNGLNGAGAGCNTIGTYDMYDEAGTLLFSDPTSNGNWGSNEVHNFCITSVYAADFSSSPQQICLGSEVQFYDLSTTGTNAWTWSFPGGNPSTSNLQNPIVVYNNPGVYDVTLFAGDGTNSHTKTIVGQITVYSSPINSVVFDSISCFGECTAMIDLTVAGGTMPFVYSWNDGDLNEDRDDLCSGNYQVILSDDNGCRDTSSVIIYAPTQIDFAGVVSQATCGVNDGSINTTITGGVLPYDILWSNGETTSSISNLGIGSYYLSVTDNNGCEIVQSYAITNPNAPIVDANGINETCGGNCDGELHSTATGGTGTLVFSWDNGLGSDDTITNLCAGTYILSVIDDNSCEDRDTVIIDAGTPYPNVNFTVSNDTIGVGQTINFVNLTSGANQHLWYFGDGDSSVFSSTPHSYDSAGVYTVILTSCKNGCCGTDTMLIYVGDFTAIDEFNKNEYVSIYPNPTNDFLTIDLKLGEEASSIKIYDNTGRLIVDRQETLKKYLVDMSNLSSGVYLAEIKYMDVVLPFKIIKR